MAVERVTLWTSAAAAGATLVAVAFSAMIIWNAASKQRVQFMAELTALNTRVEAISAKIDKASETVAEIKKITALETTTKQIELLNSEIKKTNEKLGELQQSSSLDGIKTTLAQLDSKIDKTGAALVELKKAAPDDAIKADFDGVKSTLAQLDAKMAKTDAALAELKTAPNGDIKTEFDGIKSALASLTAKVEAKIEASDKTLADIKASVHADKTQSAGDMAAGDKAIATLSTAVGDLKAGMADAVLTQNKSLDTLVKSVDSLKTTVVAQKAEMDSQVRHAAEPPAPETTSSIPISQPLTVHFDDRGRQNLAAQTNAVIGSLKTIMKDRRACSISVAGHTDTIGRDDVNLDVSKERADLIAAKLKTAFAGQKIQIDSVGWGERQLKVWTPDGRSEMTNRRVEVSVDCKG